jgi:transposase
VWILANGSTWRSLPPKYGKWNSVYKKFQKWSADGLFDNLIENNAEKSEIIAIDSTFCKVHQSAAGARKIYGNQDIGVSRGGKSTKIHFLINEKMQPVKFLLSAGNVNDNQLALPLFRSLNLKGKKILADKAYSSFEIRHFLENLGAVICIPDKINCRLTHNFDKELYKQRNIIERFFCKLKNYRRIATRYDKLSISFSAFISLAIFLISQ